MAEKRCARGHVIDASWDLCPYCPPDAKTGEVPVIRPRDPERRDWPPRAPEARAAPPTQPPPHRTSPQADPAPVSRTVAVPKADLGVATAPPRFVVGWLVGLTGTLRGESFPVRIGKTTIGRDPRSDVVVYDDQTSAHHADLVYRPEERRFILMDHNSTNGTYVNEEEIEPRRNLKNQDVVRIGGHRFLFVVFEVDWEDPRMSQ